MMQQAAPSSVACIFDAATRDHIKVHDGIISDKSPMEQPPLVMAVYAVILLALITDCPWGIIERAGLSGREADQHLAIDS